MDMEKDLKKRTKALEKELKLAQKQEQKLQKEALKAKPAAWKTKLESLVPQKIYFGLESTFAKAFSMVFSQGRGIIEKTYKKENLQSNYAIRDYAVRLKGRRKELKQMHKGAKRADGLNILLTTAEGVALGALGVGMPDIVLFLSTLLKGIYETALNYGFDYENRKEQYLILKMMACALTAGPAWEEENGEIDELMQEMNLVVEEEALNTQIRQTASVFAMDMLLLKFIQGLPVVGILGGAANPVYYRKVMDYVQLKYKKRYLLLQWELLEQ